MDFISLVIIGLLVGAAGALVGFGGGFLVVPLLLFTTDLSPQVIAGTSLATILLNTLSGTIAYSRQAKIDYKLGKLLAIAIIPGAVIGVHLNQRITLQEFSIVLGALITLAALLMFRGCEIRIPHFIPNPTHAERRIVDSSGNRFEYKVSLRRTILLSFMVGVVSQMVGIGGGTLLVPLMVMVIGFPPRIAAATSQFVTLAASAVAVIIFAHYSQIEYAIVMPLGLGVIFGAQIGAQILKRSGCETVRYSMACVLLLVGVWLLAENLL